MSPLFPAQSQLGCDFYSHENLLPTQITVGTSSHKCKILSRKCIVNVQRHRTSVLPLENKRAPFATQKTGISIKPQSATWGFCHDAYPCATHLAGKPPPPQTSSLFLPSNHPSRQICGSLTGSGMFLHSSVSHLFSLFHSTHETGRVFSARRRLTSMM